MIDNGQAENSVSRTMLNRWLREHKTPLLSLAHQLALPPGSFSVMTVRGKVSLQTMHFNLQLAPMNLLQSTELKAAAFRGDDDPVMFTQACWDEGLVLAWCKSQLREVA